MNLTRIVGIGVLIAVYPVFASPTFGGTITVTGSTDNGGTTKWRITNGDGVTDDFNVTSGSGASASSLLNGLLTQLQSREKFRDLGSISGDTLTIKGDKGVTLLSNTAKFQIKLAELPPLTPPPDQGMLSFQGDPSGVSVTGTASSFASSFGFTHPNFGTVISDSFLNFGDLSSPTVAGLLTATFNQLSLDLPFPLQSNLQLNLTGGLINFSFPQGATSGFVTNFSSDMVTDVGAGITAVPEPTSLALLTLGLVALLCHAGWQCRRWQGGQGKSPRPHAG